MEFWETFLFVALLPFELIGKLFTDAQFWACILGVAVWIIPIQIIWKLIWRKYGSGLNYRDYGGVV